MDKVLSILDQDAKFTPEQISQMVGRDVQEVAELIERYEQEKVILGYKTIIDWEKTDRELVTALIEVKVTPQAGMGFDKIATAICKYKEVESVYLMSGGFDLTVIVTGRTMKEVAYFVSNKLAPMQAVLSTGTHFVLKKYKEQGIRFDGNTDERGVIFV
ncbi:MAG: Lrp/AsnC family transcriptional regulator [Eubacteriales bacterium]|jgi:DNA-binding Lrp family transcriptional regulator